MNNENHDPLFDLIKTIEDTHRQLATEHDPATISHLQAVLRNTNQRLSNLTHEHSVAASDATPERER